MSICVDDMNEIVLRAASIVLENGGETYRTEDTVVYIAKSLGAVSASAFVTPTVIMFSWVDNENHHHATFKRITKRVVNLRKVAQVNDLSRRLMKRGRTSNSKQVENLLNRIEKAPEYSKTTIIIAAAVSSFMFSFMFGGNWKDGVAALCIGFILRVVVIWQQKLFLNSFITSLISGGIISVLSELVYFTHFINSPVIITTAVLMQVVPGLAIVNAIRDIIAGDLVSGNARIVEAFMIAAGLSIGSVLGLFCFSGVTGLVG